MLADEMASGPRAIRRQAINEAQAARDAFAALSSQDEANLLTFQTRTVPASPFRRFALS
ncbi:MAG TPA: hypothetical protein VGX48_22540 [Pyrinomonadaceae bacterium]|jgi:hypothetical protein|nr:hypothetical protein [Pyrinomonadaceae bacterium]